jgi:hypothetical protein
MIFRANVRLIVWLNTSRLSGSTAQVEQDIINALHEEPTETFPASRIVCKIVSRLSGPGIFTRYTFDEAENQQLMPPFQYFAYNLNVNFAIAPACATSTVIQTAPQC